jgi:hypothetical protein
MKRVVGCLLVALGLTACATGPSFQEAPPPLAGKALLYLMRPTVGGGSFWSTKFSVNDAPIVLLASGGYSWINLDAGTYEISAQYLHSEPLRIKITVPAGGARYVAMRQGETVNVGNGQRRDLLVELAPETARIALAKLKYTEASATKAP